MTKLEKADDRLIRVGDASHLIQQYFRKNYVVDGEWYAGEIIRELEVLPSAEKTGKWLYDKHYLVHVCSECDEQALEEYTVNPHTLDRDYDEVLSEYCPHCGSRMLEIEEEEDEEDE